MKCNRMYKLMTVAFTSLTLLMPVPVLSAETVESSSSVTDEYPLKNDGQMSDMAIAQASYDKAKAVYDEGSFGFFDSVNATSAIDALTNSSISSYTKKGDPQDATSLENMKMALDNIVGQIDSTYFNDTEPAMTYVEKCNYLRAKNNVGELKITDYLMAAAQADCNYSDTVIGHAKAFNIGENLAWNYGSDPFYQWYDEEYAEFLNGVTAFSEIGHYKNIIDSSYNYTGFAICTRGTMNRWKTYGQTFDSWGSDTSYTPAEYKERFMTYYNSVTSSLSKAQTALQNAVSSDAKPVISSSSLTYTGEEIRPVTVITEAGKTLTEGTHYTITYHDNINPGTATATIKGIGTYSGTTTISFQITKKTEENTASTGTVSTSNGDYQVITANGTKSITYTAPSDNNKTTVTVPTTVKINGKKYKVTSIAKNAFKNNRKLKKITIGKNIKTIGAKAFYGCTNLKKVTFKTKVLKKIGKKAFNKIHKKAKFKYPKGKKKKYKKLLKKSKK